MRQILFSLLFLLVLSCSNGHHTFVIDGTTSPKLKDGQKIYLVPLTNANWNNVDSTYILNGRFAFKGDTERVCIVRLPILDRMKAQEMLVITEPGKTYVTIGPNSSVRGTPQNELMQRWKEAVTRQKEAYSAYMEAKKTVKSQTAISNLRKRYEQAFNDYQQLSSAIIHHHKDKTIGKFVARQTGLQ